MSEKEQIVEWGSWRKKAPEDKMGKVWAIRLTEAEHQKVLEYAKKEGIAMSQLGRRLAMRHGILDESEHSEEGYSKEHNK